GDPGDRQLVQGRLHLQLLVVACGGAIATAGVHHRHEDSVVFHSSVAAPRIAEQLGAAHLKPGEEVGMVGDPHPIDLGVTDPEGGHRPNHSTASRILVSRSRAFVQASPFPKTALPATSRSAPARTSSEAFSGPTPPSTSMRMDSPRLESVSCRARTL